jgi:predicted small integral membrane protein
MTIGDRIFWSVICFVVISLLWLKFLEPFFPLWGSLIVSGVVAFLIANYKRK